MSLDGVLTAVSVIILIFAIVAYRIICKKHREDPDFVERQKRRQEELREVKRQEEEDEELETYMANMSDYNDEE
jgi:hypothetical protein